MFALRLYTPQHLFISLSIRMRTIALIATMFMVCHALHAQQTKATRRVIEIQPEQTFNLTRVWHSRAYVSVDIPPNTVEWFIAFRAMPDTATPQSMNVFGQLTKLFDPSGASSVAVNSLLLPDGTARCDVMLTDLPNQRLFMAQSKYSYITNLSRINLTHGVIRVDGRQFNGNRQILLYNSSITTKINVTVSVSAVVQEQQVDYNTWAPASRDTLFNIYVAAFTKQKMDADAAKELASCVVERTCRQKTPADMMKLSQSERLQLSKAMFDSCVQTMQGGPRTEVQEMARNYGDLGWKAYERGEVDKCIEYSKKALAMDSTLGWVHANLGLCYLIRGDQSSATDCYVKAIASHRRDRLSMKRHLEAEVTDIDDAVKKHPTMQGYQDVRELLRSNITR